MKPALQWDEGTQPKVMMWRSPTSTTYGYDSDDGGRIRHRNTGSEPYTDAITL